MNALKYSFLKPYLCTDKAKLPFFLVYLKKKNKNKYLPILKLMGH